MRLIALKPSIGVDKPGRIDSAPACYEGLEGLLTLFRVKGVINSLLSRHWSLHATSTGFVGDFILV